ncbi:DEAD/DEAH box helicase [Janthinobacterium tructae]
MDVLNDLRQEIIAASFPADAFSILSTVSKFCYADYDIGRELVIRVLDRREELDADHRHILDELAIQVGLHPYVNNLEGLSLRGALAHASNRAEGDMEDFVLHSAQSRVLNLLLEGMSVILSAPTSFGKSLLIDLAISAKNYSNVILIVPTLALVEETRRRMARFSHTHNIVTTSNQKIGERNIFVFTQERYLSSQAEIPPPDFFVIDEFYKLSIQNDGGRATQLNQAFLRLVDTGAQFYLLGPAIGSIPSVVGLKTNCVFIVEKFQTVAIELHTISKKPNKDFAFAALLDELKGQTLVYCQSPASTRKVLKAYLDNRPIPITEDIELVEAAEWTAANYHEEWLVSVALMHGIGIHHGRLPRSLGRFMIRAFEEGKLKLLLCTSTLIEGVNTAAKNVIIFDSKLNNKALDFFTFNNIRGRSGRMFRHFIGHVYVFDAPPEPELPFVDIPVFNPTETTPNSLLLQIGLGSLPPKLQDRVRPFIEQTLIPVDLIKKLSSIEPEFIVQAASHIILMTSLEISELSWSSHPQYENIKATSNIIWNQLNGANAAKHSGVHTANMMTFWIWELYKSRSVPKFREKMIAKQIESGKSPDDAVENVLAFLRSWASFSYPKYLMAVSDIADVILQRRGMKGCNYVSFAASIEHLFQPNTFSSLEEFGLPFEISSQLVASRVFDKGDELDAIIRTLRNISLDKFANGIFERRLLEDFKEGLVGGRKVPG